MIGNIVLHHDINLQTSPQTATDAEFSFYRASASCCAILIYQFCQSVRCIPVIPSKQLNILS